VEIRNRPIFTDTFDSLQSFVPNASSFYVFGTSVEERSAHSLEWEARARGVSFVRIIEQNEASFIADFGSDHLTVALRSNRQLTEFFNRLKGARIYVDMTGLEHQVWAPLVRVGIAVGAELSVVYVEPSAYRRTPTPREGDIFDLSEEIRGISPLPGFASLHDSNPEDSYLVSLLGFEGIRFKFMIEQTQPAKGRIVPVVGVPGFRSEYPFFTYDGNRPLLEETQAWTNVRFARANCPFSAVYTLEDIASHYPQATMKISMIGTKPHALGAILYWIRSSQPVELIYDHPIRKARRTEGASRALVYDVWRFAQ
jgi:hypothetical protein